MGRPLRRLRGAAPGLRSLLADAEVKALTARGSTLLAGQVGAGALALALAVLLARGLGADDYGRFALIGATVSIVSQVIDVRVWEAATRYASDHLARGRRVEARAVLELALLVNLVGGVLATALLAVAAHPLAVLVLHDPGLGSAVVIFGATAPCIALQNASWTVFRVFDRFGQLALLIIASSALRLGAAAAALAAGGGLVSIFAALLGAELVAAATLVWAAHRRLEISLPTATSARQRMAGIRGDLAEMGRFLFVSNLTGTLRIANERLDVVVVGILGFPAAAGTLNLARTFVQPLAFLYRPFYEAVYPKLAHARARAQLAEAWALVGRMTRLAGVVFALGAAAISVASPWLLPALAGDEYRDAYQAVIPLALGTAVVGTMFCMHPAALTIDMRTWALGSLASATAVQVLATLLLVPALGAAGAGIAYALFAVIWALLLAPAVRDRMLELSGRAETTTSADARNGWWWRRSSLGASRRRGASGSA
jgi:O-antigen/teichoic acid export membrane protein